MLLGVEGCCHGIGINALMIIRTDRMREAYRTSSVVQGSGVSPQPKLGRASTIDVQRKVRRAFRLTPTSTSGWQLGRV